MSENGGSCMRVDVVRWLRRTMPYTVETVDRATEDFCNSDYIMLVPKGT